MYRAPTLFFEIGSADELADLGFRRVDPFDGEPLSGTVNRAPPCQEPGMFALFFPVNAGDDSPHLTLEMD